MKLKFLSTIAVASFALSAQAQTYVVGVEDLPFMPHYSTDKQGTYSGFAREVLDLFAADAGVQFEYRPLAGDRLLPALLQGQVDFKYPDNPEWSSAQKAGSTLHYSQAVVHYVDGVLVPPNRQGQGTDTLQRLAIVSGWTPRAYQSRVDAGQVRLLESQDLPEMIKLALKKDADGAYFNVVVATYYLDNIRARPGALVFDPKLPYTRGTFHLSSLKQPALIQLFDQFLAEQHEAIAKLKDKYQVEANLDSEFMGMEQWKVDFLKRQKAKQTP